MKLKIWLFLDSRSYGGIESHVLTLARALHQQGVQVRVVLWRRYGQDHPMEAELNQLNIPCLVVTGSAVELYRQLRSEKPHVVHTHGYKASLLARLFKAVAKFRLISSFHAGEVSGGKVGLYDVLDRYTARFADECIAISGELARRIKAPSQLLHNFVALPPSGWQSEGNEIAFVGRLSHEKAPERFVALARQFPTHQFAIYGDGPMARTLTESAPGNLKFYGRVSNMDEHWHKIALLCLPSRYEGLPMAVLEAMAHGIPVLASPVGEMPRLIKSGQTGWLVEGAEVELWQQALSFWLGLSEAQKLSMKAAAHQLVASHYSVASQLPKLLHLYRGGVILADMA